MSCSCARELAAAICRVISWGSLTDALRAADASSCGDCCRRRSSEGATRLELKVWKEPRGCLVREGSKHQTRGGTAVASAVALLLLVLQVQVLLGLLNELMSLKFKSIAYENALQTLNPERKCTVIQLCCL